MSTSGRQEALLTLFSGPGWSKCKERDEVVLPSAGTMGRFHTCSVQSGGHRQPHGAVEHLKCDNRDGGTDFSNLI